MPNKKKHNGQSRSVYLWDENIKAIDDMILDFKSRSMPASFSWVVNYLIKTNTEMTCNVSET